MQNANNSLSAAQLYCELSVGTALSVSCCRLICVNVSLDRCLLENDWFQLLVFIGVDVRSQYFVQCSVSVNINCIQITRCCSLFWHYKRKRENISLAGLCVGECNIPCANEQERCCIVLNVGKSKKPNPSVGVLEFHHTQQRYSHCSLGQHYYSFIEC